MPYLEAMRNGRITVWNSEETVEDQASFIVYPAAILNGTPPVIGPKDVKESPANFRI